MTADPHIDVDRARPRDTAADATRPQPHDATLHAVHVDPALIVVDKPAGLLSVPGRGAAGADNLTARVQARWPDALVVHRLDMATSGLMLWARGAAVQRAMSDAFARRAVDKWYVAVVHGVLVDDAGEIDAALTADWPRRPRQIVVDGGRGKASQTRWRVLARDAAGQRTRLELQPLTGRSHQLRVHLQHIGHPICGDTLYGPQPASGERLLLHASRLAFDHPTHRQRCVFESAPSF